jgi:organic hydroperoxide reductase OsmC/OhrA
VTRFTEFAVRAILVVPAGTRRDKAEKLLETAEKNCLITNSLNVKRRLAIEVIEK